MPSYNRNDVMTRLVKDVYEIQTALRRVTANLPLYDISNENTPTILAANQNNYNPGNYDILRLASTTTINITGISDGKKGRKLQIFNVGSYAITLSHASGLSLAANRFNFVNSSDFIIPVNGNVLLYYDSTQTRWIGGDLSSIYDVLNESTPAQITSNQNNYSIGLAEVLRLSTDASRTITGISGGVKGRSLQIFNVGNFNITLAYESGSSSAENRFYSPSTENTVLYPKAGVKLYYDSTLQRWMIPDAPTWMGKYGKTCIVSASATQSIPDNTTTKITCLDTVVSDEWGMWSVANQRITVPETGVYFGSIGFQFPGNLAGDGTVRAVSWRMGVLYLGVIQVPPCAYPVATDIAVPLFYKFDAGDIVEMYVLQDCGSSLSVTCFHFAFGRIM